MNQNKQSIKIILEIIDKMNMNIRELIQRILPNTVIININKTKTNLIIILEIRNSDNRIQNNRGLNHLNINNKINLKIQIFIDNKIII